MSRTKEFALTLAEDFKAAEYFSEVDQTDGNAFIELLMILPEKDANEVASALLDIPADKDEADMTEAEQMKVGIFQMVVLGHTLGKVKDGLSLGNDTKIQSEASDEAERMVRGMYEEAKAHDPAFAKWAFGPNVPT